MRKISIFSTTLAHAPSAAIKDVERLINTPAVVAANDLLAYIRGDGLRFTCSVSVSTPVAAGVMTLINDLGHRLAAPRSDRQVIIDHVTGTLMLHQVNDGQPIFTIYGTIANVFTAVPLGPIAGYGNLVVQFGTGDAKTLAWLINGCLNVSHSEAVRMMAKSSIIMKPEQLAELLIEVVKLEYQHTHENKDSFGGTPRGRIITGLDLEPLHSAKAA